MWSSAVLDCVVSPCPCRQRRQGLQVVSGLELQYEDGSTTTIGEVRLDCMGDRIAIYSARVWLGFVATKERFPCLTTIEVTHPAHDTLAWFEVPMLEDSSGGIHFGKCKCGTRAGCAIGTLLLFCIDPNDRRQSKLRNPHPLRLVREYPRDPSLLHGDFRLTGSNIALARGRPLEC